MHRWWKRGKEKEKERGVTLSRGGREMGEVMDRAKTAYATGVVLDFKNLQLFIQDGDDAASNPTNGPRPYISTFHIG
jgi:hypothetical protein